MFNNDKVMPEVNAFRQWYEKAGVRSEPRKLIGEDDDIEKAFFPEHLVPHLNHPLVPKGDALLRRYLVAQHAYQWLRFTMHFEVAVVARASQKIADGSTGLLLTEDTRMDAYKIVVDEGYHSLYSLDVQRQLVKRSGIPALDYDFGPFISGLDEVGTDFPEHWKLVQLLQVVVFETLVTSILSDVPKDHNVVDIMRETVQEHAIDEGRHHAFFVAFFKHLWSQLDHRLRQKVAEYLPDLVIRSLRPASDPARNALLVSGFGQAQVSDIIAESFSADRVLAGIRHSADKTLRLFEEVGVFDIPGARDRFTAKCLILS